jgi:hypothetical protein
MSSAKRAWHEKLQYNTPADLREKYPHFFWNVVQPFIGDALHYLRITQEGQQWIANLYANARFYPSATRGASLSPL